MDDERSKTLLWPMEIRDWFAAMALQGLCGNMTIRHYEHEFAARAYKMADAMIAERNKEIDE